MLGVIRVIREDPPGAGALSAPKTAEDLVHRRMECSGVLGISYCTRRRSNQAQFYEGCTAGSEQG